MKKILIVFGTRPEAIKMVPLIKEFSKHPTLFDVKVCVTAQHRQMLDSVLEIFDIKPDYDLNIMLPDQGLTDMTAKILTQVGFVLHDYNPDILLVHGDTTTSMASALAAFYQNIKIGHVEAGLRTYNLHSPWPEEMNRQFTDKISDLYFAPTQNAKENLINEGVDNWKIIVTGNTVIDTLFLGQKIIEERKLKPSILELIKDSGFDMNEHHFIKGRP